MRAPISEVVPSDISQPEVSRTIFIWLDILGFSASLEDEARYMKLARALKRFKGMFDESTDYRAQVISDGIILWIKEYPYADFQAIFEEIGRKQEQFILETSEFIRGGIALGTKLEVGEVRAQGDDSFDPVSSGFISNGLARAVAVESRKVTWPVIGIPPDGVRSIRKDINATNEDEVFDLIKGYNAMGEEIYFVDFLRESREMRLLIERKIKEFSKAKPEIQAKYRWLLSYYLAKHSPEELSFSARGAIV